MLLLVFIGKNILLTSLMKIIPHTHFCTENLTASTEKSYIKITKRYLDSIISIIASYAPLITFWTSLFYTIPEREAYAIIKDCTTISTTPEPDQVDIKPIPFPITTPCLSPQLSFRATDVKICYTTTLKSKHLCTIL